MDKARIQITEQESSAVFKAITDGNKFVIVRGNYIVTSAISGIYKDETFDDKNEGRLHDGTRVVKKFGLWVMKDNPDVRIDPHYYPEIANDSVMSPREYEQRTQQIALRDGNSKDWSQLETGGV